MTKENIIYPELSYRLTGILFEVHNKLGQYCSEKQYADAIEQALKEHSVNYQREIYLPFSFKGEAVNRNKIDFLIEDLIILELKASRLITKQDYYQIQRYLTASNKKLGIIANFHNRYLSPKRILNPQAN